MTIPAHWDCSYNGLVNAFGRLEFGYSGTGGSRQDPLQISISPKPGADLTGYEFSTVSVFVEPNNAGYYFAAHIAGFTADSTYWEDGSSNPNSAYFAVGEYAAGLLPLVVPDPATLSVSVLALGAFIAALMRRMN